MRLHAVVRQHWIRFRRRTRLVNPYVSCFLFFPPGAKEAEDRRRNTLPQHQERVPQTQLQRVRPPARPLLQSLSGTQGCQ